MDGVSPQSFPPVTGGKAATAGIKQVANPKGRRDRIYFPLPPLSPCPPCPLLSAPSTPLLTTAMFRLGTDIVYIPRIQAVVERFGDRFLQRVYTPAEQLDCGCAENSLSRAVINKLAGRWAAKEAIVKALGTGWRGIGYTEIEIRRRESGAPVVHLHGRATAVVGVGKAQWQISLSHDGDYAIATALLVYSQEKP